MTTIPLRKPSVLIVDDDENVVEAYVSALGNTYSILVARCGEDIYSKRILLKNIDLVLIDYRLPDLPGMEVLKDIKKINPSAVCIMITGYGDEDLAVSAFRSGARDYLKKPVDYNELQEKMAFYFSLKKTGKEKRKNVIFDDYPMSTDILASKGDSEQDKIRKAVVFINENAAAKISLSAAASEACMSKYHFSRVFKRTMGVSYQAFLTNLRIEKAKKMLALSHLPVTEIAFSVGYEDVSHFNKMFKKLLGCSPRRYRNTATK